MAYLNCWCRLISYAMLDLGFGLNYSFVLTSVWFHAICLPILMVDDDVHCMGGMFYHAVVPTFLLTDYISMLRPARIN